MELTFYSRDWSEIASRRTMAKVISATTRIELKYLFDNSLVKDASVAEKMSWVSRRVTTRIEDMAYCMLGIFDINMPLLYGEGSKSFIRLQEEIIRTSNDHTIFCWTWIDLVPPDWVSLLAPCPQTFRNSGNYVTADNHLVSKLTFKMTNAGLSITLPIVQAWSYYLGVLNARIRYDSEDYVARIACVPIQGRLDTDGSRSRAGLMRRISFPPGPVTVYAPWVLCQSRLYIQSDREPSRIIHRPGLLPPIDDPGAPLRSSSFLLAFDNVEQLIDDDTRSLGNIRSNHFNGICLMESANDVIWTKVYPPGAFDPHKSCIVLSLTASYSGALIRLGMNAQSRVLFIGAVLREIRPYRFCGIVPNSIVRASRSETEILSRVISAAREKKEDCDVSWGYGIGMTMGEPVSTDSGIISVTYITCEREHVGVDVLGTTPADEAEQDSDNDAHSDIAVADGFKKVSCRLFSSEDY